MLVWPSIQPTQTQTHKKKYSHKQLKKWLKCVRKAWWVVTSFGLLKATGQLKLESSGQGVSLKACSLMHVGHTKTPRLPANPPSAALWQTSWRFQATSWFSPVDEAHEGAEWLLRIQLRSQAFFTLCEAALDCISLCLIMPVFPESLGSVERQFILSGCRPPRRVKSALCGELGVAKGSFNESFTLALNKSPSKCQRPLVPHPGSSDVDLDAKWNLQDRNLDEGEQGQASSAIVERQTPNATAKIEILAGKSIEGCES